MNSVANSPHIARLSLDEFSVKDGHLNIYEFQAILCCLLNRMNRHVICAIPDRRVDPAKAPASHLSVSLTQSRPGNKDTVRLDTGWATAAQTRTSFITGSHFTG